MVKSYHIHRCLLKCYTLVTTLAVITSTAVAQTLTINNTNTIIVTISSLTTTSFNVMNSTAVSPTTTLTHSVSEDISTGFVYEPSSTVIVEVTDTQYTAVLVLTTSVLATNADSSTAVVVRPTDTPNKTSSISNFIIGVIVGVALAAIVFVLSLVIYFVVSNKKRRTKSHQDNQASRIGMGVIADEAALVYYNKHHQKPHEVVNDNKHDEDSKHHEGVLNADSIVLLQNDSTINRSSPEPYLEPNPVAMEEVVNDNEHDEDNKHHEMVNNSKHNKGKICDGVSNAYSIVLLQNDSTIDRAAPEPYLEPNPVAMEEVVNDNKHDEDDKHHEMVNNNKHNKGKICDGVSNAYSIVLLQKDSTIDRAASEPYLEPNPVAMEYETPINRTYENIQTNNND